MDSPVRHFQPTRWTLIAEVGGADPAVARAALEKLCGTYWYPLYAYTRRRGYGPEDAEDLVQGFFARLIGRETFATASRERGRLRSFLIHQLECHLTDDIRRRAAAKRGGGRSVVSINAVEAERLYGQESRTEETPETLYHRRWALTLLAEALRVLEREYRGGEFALLKPALTEPTATAIDTAAVAAALGIPRDQVRVRVHRLRAKFREVLCRCVGATLRTNIATEVQAETRALLSSLR